MSEEIQFDPKYHGYVSSTGKRNSDHDALRKQFGVSEGFQIKKIRRPRKNIPWWANNDKKLRTKVFHTRGNALRNYTIAHLYWRCGWNAREVASQLNLSQGAVEQILSRLRRT